MRRFSQHSLMLVVFIIAVLLAAFEPEASSKLRFDREAIAQGEWWRLLSAHVVHLGLNHLLMNMLGWVLLWVIFARELSQLHWLSVFFLSAMGVSAGLWWLNPELYWYVGLSGVLHGVFAAGLIMSIKHWRSLEMLLLLAFAGKLLWEQFAGAMPGSEEMAGGRVIVDAHLYGALAVLPLVFVYRLIYGRKFGPKRL